MSQDFHITSIERCDIPELGIVIKVTACPYEDTPFGYCYISNKWKEFYFPFSNSNLQKLIKPRDDDDFTVNFDNFIYRVGYGYIHKSFTVEGSNNTNFVPIDLGLSVLWADRNLGANNPEDYGVMKSYNELINSDLIPKGWRLPTSSEFEELISLSNRPSRKSNDCYFLNGSQHIYFPPAGCAVDLNVYRQGQWGQYLGVYTNKKDVQCSFTVATVGHPFIGASFDADKLHSVRLVKDK